MWPLTDRYFDGQPSASLLVQDEDAGGCAIVELEVKGLGMLIFRIAGVSLRV